MKLIFDKKLTLSDNIPHQQFDFRLEFFMLEICIIGAASGIAELSFLEDRTDSQVLPFKDGIVCKRILRRSRHKRNLHINVPENKKGLSLVHFSLQPLFTHKAKKLMAKKLKSRHYYQQQDLWQRYQNVFDYKSRLYLANTPPEKLQIADAKQILSTLSTLPLISIVLPCYDSDREYLEQTIRSVQEQSYPHWQLCIVDDNSKNREHIELIDRIMASESRIKFYQRTLNGHISAASNDAIAMANGEYIGLLDHDDLLHTHALLLCAQAIHRNPEAAVLYSDEDKINQTGQHYEAHFKPDFNRDLLYTQNYISHFGLYKKTLLKKINGFRNCCNGSQDFDLVLRCLPYIKESDIIHIPHVLYHWRALENSTASHSEAKSYTHEAGKRALNDYFKAENIQIKVEDGEFPNTYRSTWPLPEDLPLVSLIIPTRDAVDILKQCIESIINKTRYDHYEILIINNQSQCKKTLAYLKQCQNHPLIRVIDYDFAFNYSAINNFAVDKANGDIIGLINNDIEVISDNWLDEMVSHALRRDVGCVGAKLYYPNNNIQHAGVILGIDGVANHVHKNFSRYAPGYFGRLFHCQNFSAVTAACLIVEKSIYLEVSGLNETDLQVAFNDIDFCLKVREAGYRNLWSPWAELYHHESLSRGAEDNPEKLQRFEREVNFMKEKWGDMLLNDPFYNPNLSLLHIDYRMR